MSLEGKAVVVFTTVEQPDRPRFAGPFDSKEWAEEDEIGGAFNEGDSRLRWQDEEDMGEEIIIQDVISTSGRCITDRRQHDVPPGAKEP